MTHPGFEDIRLATGHVRLAARACGPADGAPVLALHGWMDNAARFDRLAPLLDGVRLVALDFPGHGHSDHRPPGCGYHFVDYTGDVLAAADALGWERFTLLGHSLGGAVATLVAGAGPERIERLALIEALGPLTDDAANAPTRLAEALARGRRPDRPGSAPDRPSRRGARRRRNLQPPGQSPPPPRGPGPRGRTAGTVPDRRGPCTHVTSPGTRPSGPSPLAR